MRIGIDCRKMFDFGIGTYVLGLVRGLAQLQGDEEYVLFAPSRGIELLPESCERVPMDVPNYTIAEQFVLPPAIRRARLDVFHSPHFVLPLVQSCPTIMTLHDLIYFRYPPANPIGRLYMIALTSHDARVSDRILTVSEAARSDIVAVLDCEPRNVIVTPNGVDDRFFRPGPRAMQWERYFLYVGNDKPHKNVPRLIEAFRRLRARDSSVSLVLIGAPFERYRDVDGVICAGQVDDDSLVAAYRGARALVMVSLEEGFGLPAVEAMACGTPVIVSTTPALVEVTGDAALHVDPRSVSAIADAMSRLENDEGLRALLSSRGPDRARRYTWRRCAELTRNVYRDVASRRGVARSS
jgi:glycosyltransferase involved in cell wall biosynthesis